MRCVLTLAKRSITVDWTSGLFEQDIKTFQNRISGLSRSGNGAESKNSIFNISRNVLALGFTFASIPYNLHDSVHWYKYLQYYEAFFIVS